MKRYKVSIVVDNCKDEAEAANAAATFLHMYARKHGPYSEPKFEEMCTECYADPCTCDEAESYDASARKHRRFHSRNANHN